MKEYTKNSKYIIYEDGRIFSKRFDKFLIPKKNWDGYERIQLWDKGKCTMPGIHRLVAEMYIPNPYNYPVVNHKNGIKNDNRVENLEWCTQSQNILHAFKTKLSKPQINGKLSKRIDQFDIDWNFIKTWESTMEIERQLNIKHVNISYACKSNTNFASGYKWKYSETSND